MPVSWEYRTLKIPTKMAFFSGVDFDSEQFDRVLNDMGETGWELVSVATLQSPNNGTSRWVMATLKRPKK